MTNEVDEVIEPDTEPKQTPHDWDATYHKAIDATVRMGATLTLISLLKWGFNVSLFSGWTWGAGIAGLWIILNSALAFKVIWDDGQEHSTDDEAEASNSKILLFKDVVLFLEVLAFPAALLVQMQHINNSREKWQRMAHDLQAKYEHNA